MDRGIRHDSDRFYVEEFGTLRSMTRQIPEATLVVEFCLGLGLKIVVPLHDVGLRFALLQILVGLVSCHRAAQGTPVFTGYGKCEVGLGLGSALLRSLGTFSL